MEVEIIKAKGAGEDTSTGRKNCAAPDTGVGLECDKFSKQAIQLHFNKMMDLLYPLIKPYVHQIQSSTYLVMFHLISLLKH